MKKSDQLRIAVAIIFLIGGIYVAYLAFVAPRHIINTDTTSQNQFVKQHAAQVNTQNTLIIPKISVDAPINPGGRATLDNGAIWHRQPHNGDPVDGGNFVLAGHRYQFLPTPQQTIQSSVLYDLDKLQIGDTILVDWLKKRYSYIVTKTYSVTPRAVEIEKRSEQSKMTLYTCTLEGAADGRIVIEAKPTEQ